MRLPFRSRLQAGLAAGVTSAAAAACVTVIRRRARRRTDRRNAAFARASEGIWPAVPTRPAEQIHIAADRSPGATDASTSSPGA